MDQIPLIEHQVREITLRVDRLEQTLGQLDRVVRQSNGHPSLVQRVDVLEDLHMADQVQELKESVVMLSDLAHNLERAEATRARVGWIMVGAAVTVVTSLLVAYLVARF